VSSIFDLHQALIEIANHQNNPEIILRKAIWFQKVRIPIRYRDCNTMLFKLILSMYTPNKNYTHFVAGCQKKMLDTEVGDVAAKQDIPIIK